MRPLRLGTRDSALAIRQSTLVADVLRRLGIDVDLVPDRSPGDDDTRPLPGRATEGVFASSLRAGLLDGRIDLAVHSYKDLPVDPAPGLAVLAVPRREDPRDTLLTRGPAGLDGLAHGAVVGTCSVRRAAWVHRTRPDLEVRPIRGPIDARMDRLRRGEFDAVVLAEAGLVRLGAPTPPAWRIPLADLVPAPAQGALAVEGRADDVRVARVVSLLDDRSARLAATCERAVLAAVDPTDATPVGAVAVVRGGALHVLADISGPDGSGRVLLRRSIAVPAVAAEQAAHRLGVEVASLLRPAVGVAA